MFESRPTPRITDHGQPHLLRNPFSDVGLDGLRTLERPRSTLFQDPGDGMGDVDFELALFEVPRLSPRGDPADMTIGLCDY